MSIAALPAPPGPVHCMESYLAVVARLCALGATVTHSPLPPESVSRWDAATATLHLRDGAPLVDHIWAMADFWQMVCLGAAGHGRPLPRRLYAVP